MTQSNPIRYALVMPVRDEERFVAGMMESVLAQTILPAKWIIVDDGSQDKTPEIIGSYAKRADFLELIRLPAREQRKAGGEAAITHALGRLDLSQYDFLARFDADLAFEPHYFANLFDEFRADPKLGIAGGGLYIEKDGGLEPEEVPEYHVRGALKLYRRECYEQIGGITTRIGWDTIDEVYAWTKGWKTRSFFQYKVIHRRPTGDGIHANRIYWQRGKAEYYTWSHPVFVLGKTLKLVCESRSVLKAACFLAGFFTAYTNREPRLTDPAFVRSRRQQQSQRMFSFFGARFSKESGMERSSAVPPQ